MVTRGMFVMLVWDVWRGEVEVGLWSGGEYIR